MTSTPRMLASDLDGTLIPPTADPERLDEIRSFHEAFEARPLDLAYVTGRDHTLALRGVERLGLPMPDVLVCNVGTSVYVRRPTGSDYILDEDYRRRMQAALGGADRDDLVAVLGTVPGLELQEPRKQAEFKVSYYVDPDRVEEARATVARRLEGFPIPPKLIWSHDPHSGRMLLDLLPRGVAKHVALEHLCEQGGYAVDEVVYAGDSGNDFDAFLSGHPAIVVANAPDALKHEVREGARAADILDRVYFAEARFAAGVLEGCRHFGAL